MASFSLTVEDCSPLVTYEPAGAWADSSQDDPLLPSYSGQSYHSTSTQGATATIDFYGTGLTVLGGRRTNYGNFAISVDGNILVQSTARGSENATQQTLGTISDLQPGRHRAVIENIGGLPVDIDSFVIVDAVGLANDELDTKVYDDMDPVMSYLPSQSAWGVNRLPMFQDGSIHFSQRPDAVVSMQFWGEAIAVYGTVSPDHADFKFTLDSDISTSSGGSNGGVNQLRPRTLLYYRSGLGPSRHTFSLAPNSPSPNAPFIDLDSNSIYSVPVRNFSGIVNFW
ncbi:hypothetical protein EST38_g911 [Candolleomyces aberdarensis]|uniref:Uncharacterized protein n=1 Tax=Candolleomyces aberdarensis TaxID=2316362 RepID=A0A4Q2DZL0_9AGAR|nr:hypothetical protein EST38_g911 [Candolleomyces aberdarensis]